MNRRFIYLVSTPTVHFIGNTSLIVTLCMSIVTDCISSKVLVKCDELQLCRSLWSQKQLQNWLFLMFYKSRTHKEKNHEYWLLFIMILYPICSFDALFNKTKLHILLIFKVKISFLFSDFNIWGIIKPNLCKTFFFPKCLIQQRNNNSWKTYGKKSIFKWVLLEDVFT